MKRRYAKGEEWKRVLEPWARLYASAHRVMVRHLDKLSDQQLRELLAATEQPSNSNCWWATYGAAEFIRGEVRWELGHRQSEAVRLGPWLDRQGDVWQLSDDGLMHTPETIPFAREYVEKKWGPLVSVLESPEQESS